MSRISNENLTKELGQPKKAEIEVWSSSSSSSNNSFCSKELIMYNMHSVEATDAEKEADNLKMRFFDATAW